jgi:hypothetical protein
MGRESGLADEFHAAPKKDWGRFGELVRSKKFRDALADHPGSDEVLRKYLASYGAFVRGKRVGTVTSRSDPSVRHSIRSVGDGRLGCSCKDWQFKRSISGGDCKHVESFRRTVSVGKAKAASAILLPNPLVLKGLNLSRLGLGDPRTRAEGKFYVDLNREYWRARAAAVKGG